MAMMRVATDHLSRSLGQVSVGLLEWTEQQPRWLRPSLRGALLVYAFMIWRGGLILLPLATIVALLTDPGFALRLLIVGVVMLPAGGFLGGTLYSVVHPIVRPLRILGRCIEFACASWPYFAVLYLVFPMFEKSPSPTTSLGTSLIDGLIPAVFVGGGFGAWLWIDTNPDEEGLLHELLHPSSGTLGRLWSVVAFLALGSYFGLSRWTVGWPGALAVLVAGLLFVVPLFIGLAVTWLWGKERLGRVAH